MNNSHHEPVGPASIDRADADQSSSREQGQSAPRRGIRLGWLIPIAVASIALGAVGALGVTGQIGGPPFVARTASPTVAPAGEPTGEFPPYGDLDSADALFDTEPRPKDAYPYPDPMKPYDIELTDVRFVATPDDDISVWVAKNDANELCLFFADARDDTHGGSCSTREDFENFGVAFGANDLRLSWDGRIVMIGLATR